MKNQPKDVPAGSSFAPADQKLVADIHSAVTMLNVVVKAARTAGLRVELHVNPVWPPTASATVERVAAGATITDVGEGPVTTYYAK